MTLPLYNPTTSPFKTGIACKCPRCQQGRVFNGYLKVAKACDACGLDFGFSDTADGPAFFAMSIVSPFSVAMALWLQFAYEAPIWVQAITTLPFTVLGCMFFLRPLKGWLLCSQYVHLVREGKLKS
jgi:uncharacterized protein (DUF983 family)